VADPVLWSEVVGRDGAALQKFYSSLFGWEMSSAAGDASYGFVNASAGIPGGLGASPDGGDGYVTFFVEVHDPDDKKFESLGGKTIFRPTEAPECHLTLAHFADPGGHLIGLVKGMKELNRSQ